MTERYSLNYFFVSFMYFLFLLNFIFRFFYKFYFFFSILLNFIFDLKDFFFIIILYRAFGFIFVFFGFLRAFYDTDFELYYEPEGSLFYDAAVQIGFKK